MKFFWGSTIVFSCLAGLVFLGTMALSKGAPQEAAGYAMACALAIVPYIFTRAASFFLEPNMAETLAGMAAIQKKKFDMSNE